MIPVLASEATLFASETLFVLAVIVIVGPLVAEKLRLPGLIGFMLGGVLLGPFVLGFLDEGQFDSIGGLGVLYLMFLAGLELDMDILSRYRRAVGQFGLLTFVLPFGIGWWVAASLLDYGIATAILIGSIWASHTLVSLPIVKRAGLSASRSVAVSAGATIITDTLALVVLGVISSGVVGEGGVGGQLTRLLIGLVVLAAMAAWILPWLGKWFFRGPGQDRTMRFMFLIAAMALGGLTAESFGIEGIVGAFFAGLGLNRLVPKRSNLMEKVEFVGSAFFIPAFLISVGMLIDPGVILNAETLLLAVAFTAVVLVGKGLAAVGGGLLFRFSASEIGLMFSMTIGQAAATLAAALVGVNIGLIDELVFNAAILTVLVTVLLASVLTRVFSRTVEPDKTLLQPLGASVVVPIAPDENPEPMLTIAGQLAAANTGTVSPLIVVSAGTATPEAADLAEERLEAAELVAARAGAEAEGVVRVDNSVKAGVLNVVAEKRASVVMLWGGDGRRLQDVVFGGPLLSIGGASPVPTVVGFRIPPEPERLIIGVPGRHRAFGAQVDTQIAIDLANALAPGLKVPLVALIGSGATVPPLPEDTRIREFAFTSRAELRKVMSPGDLVVVPLSLARRMLDRFGTQSTIQDGVGLLITAGPYRLHSPGLDSEEVGSILGYVAPP